ncbi:MAG: DUF4355 domain-containing protein [Propionibacteriaceae bacterium]|jgi:hypothetical protein|nr:DUF4355 domain-containing protein [Propionibacteriaceae bacterium]
MSENTAATNQPDDGAHDGSGSPITLTQPPTSTSPDSAATAQTSAPDRLFTQADLDRIITSRIAPLQAKAGEYDKLVESQKSQEQKQAEALAAMRTKLANYEAAEARREAAQSAKLDPEFAALVTGSTPEEIAESVKHVAAAYQAATKPRRPAPDPHQGRGATNEGGVSSVGQAREKFSQRFKKNN